MNVTDNDFEEKVIEQSKEKLVVADFWATWCMPCTMLAPIIDKTVKSFGNKIILAKINVDECPVTSDRYQISAIPAVKIFKDGEIVDSFEGLQSEEIIKKRIEKAL